MSTMKLELQHENLLWPKMESCSLAKFYLLFISTVSQHTFIISLTIIYMKNTKTCATIGFV